MYELILACFLSSYVICYGVLKRPYLTRGLWGREASESRATYKGSLLNLHIRRRKKWSQFSQPESLVLLWKKLTSRSRQHATQREMFVYWEIQTVCFFYPSKSIFNTWSHQILNTEKDIVSLFTLQRHEFECERSMHYQSMGRSRVHCPKESL